MSIDGSLRIQIHVIDAKTNLKIGLCIKDRIIIAKVDAKLEDVYTRKESDLTRVSKLFRIFVGLTNYSSLHVSFICSDLFRSLYFQSVP